MKTMMIDIAKCNGCFNCQIACKDEHVDNDWSPIARPQPDTGHFWMRVAEVERGAYPKVKIAYIPRPCMHCENPGCMKGAADGAVYQRRDGIVIIDPARSRGQKGIVQACPYGAVYWNEEMQIPQKCTLCAHLLDRGFKEPRCVEACPTGCLSWGERDELIRTAEAQGKAVQSMQPETGQKPSVLYIGLPGRFVAGAVILGDEEECAENATVILSGNGRDKKIKTDNYGDFEFEGLEAGRKYYVMIRHNGYAPKVIEVNTEKDVSLGTIVLERK